MKQCLALIPLVASLVASPAAPARARERQERTIEVTVISVSGRSVFIDRGRDAGVEPGLRVLLKPVGGVSVEGTVQAVASESARVELPAGAVLPPPGTTGEITLPDSAEGGAEAAQAPPPPASRVPQHPPWERREGPRAPDAPLLAPAFGRPPRERPFRFDGRLFSRVQFTRDEGDGRDSTYFTGRLGAWLLATNPFGEGGRLEFSGELDYDVADVTFDGDTEFQPIIDVASYTLGGEFYSPYILQIGRFYPDNLPEIGAIDGAAGAVQLENGVRAGGGFGIYPRPFPDRDWGEDLSLHFFVDYHSQEPGLLAAIVAYQHTWHGGAPDRDVLLGRVTMRPAEAWWLNCSWWLDIYTSSDPIKGPGVDLTQLWAQARWTPAPATGLSLSYSHSSWVETKRRQYENAPPDLVADGVIDRAEVSAWQGLAEGLLLSGRLGSWVDQDSDGIDADAALDWDDPAGSWPSLHGEVFYVQGAFNDGTGLRVQLRHRAGTVSGYAGYELFTYTATGTGGTGTFTRHTAQAGLNWSAGRMSYSLDAGFSFGDGEGAYTVGLFAEYRF